MKFRDLIVPAGIAAAWGVLASYLVNAAASKGIYSWLGKEHTNRNIQFAVVIAFCSILVLLTGVTAVLLGHGDDYIFPNGAR